MDKNFLKYSNSMTEIANKEKKHALEVGNVRDIAKDLGRLTHWERSSCRDVVNSRCWGQGPQWRPQAVKNGIFNPQRMPESYNQRLFHRTR